MCASACSCVCDACVHACVGEAGGGCAVWLLRGKRGIREEEGRVGGADTVIFTTRQPYLHDRYIFHDLELWG